MKSSFLMKYKNKECLYCLIAGMIVGLVIFAAVNSTVISIAGVQFANVDLNYGGNGLIETKDYYCRGVMKKNF
ncbi:MAG: hypothetical protein ACREVE_05825 [Gammaproteobacteria bacterium]